MRNRINNILIGLLWLLAISLGASFWFNTKYGFNIFSIPHWQYLAYMQASGQPIRTSFYISLFVIVVLAVFGLYNLLQPRYRKIILPVFDRQQPSIQQPEQSVKQQENTVQVTQTVEKKESKQTDTPVQPVVTKSEHPRPPRLNIPKVTRVSAPTPYVPLTPSKPTAKIDPEQEYADIHEIFKSAGFVYKGSPRIKNMQTSVIDIGIDETLWIGATGVSLSDIKRAIDTLSGIFADTLDDIEININAFIIDATDTQSDDSIIYFKTVDDLRTYINEHQNVPPDEDEIENFDAYSGYIGTVIDYIGKI